MLLHACHGRHEVQSGRLLIPAPPQGERQNRQGHRLRSNEKTRSHNLWRAQNRKTLQPSIFIKNSLTGKTVSTRLRKVIERRARKMGIETITPDALDQIKGFK